MKRMCAALLFAALACTGVQPAVAQKTPSDTICPGANPPLRVIHDLPDQGDATKVADAARAILRAYNDCQATARSDGFVEPAMHYDEVRAAQYQVVLGNALFKLGDYDSAHAAYAEARALSTDVAEWVPPAMSYTMNNKTGGTVAKNSGQTKSLYHDDAVTAQHSADISLARLVPVPAPSP
jgi:hypothetical protein